MRQEYTFLKIWSLFVAIYMFVFLSILNIMHSALYVWIFVCCARYTVCILSMENCMYYTVCRSMILNSIFPAIEWQKKERSWDICPIFTPWLLFSLHLFLFKWFHLTFFYSDHTHYYCSVYLYQPTSCSLIHNKHTDSIVYAYSVKWAQSIYPIWNYYIILNW